MLMSRGVLSFTDPGIALVQAGLMTFILGIFRLGFMDVILSRALLRGFITAVVRLVSCQLCLPRSGLILFLSP
jgi:Sulfate permease family